VAIARTDPETELFVEGSRRVEIADADDEMVEAARRGG
jgi:hypothetical protein